MKYFLDTEFHEDGRTIDLLSIGIVAEDDREYYAVNADFEWDRVFAPVTSEAWKSTEWLRANVMPSVNRDEGIPRTQIGGDILAFVNTPAKDTYPELIDEWDPIEFWGYYADYDWVAFCQIFGRMIDLPEKFPMFCRDIKQLCASLLNPQLPIQSGEHHALNDARWNKQAYEFLCAYALQQVRESRASFVHQILGIEPYQQ